MPLPNNSSKVKDTDRGYRKLIDEVFKFENPRLLVGILSADGGKEYDDNVTVLDVATWNEFGTERIPSRSFIRTWYDANLPTIKKKLQALLVQVVKGRIGKDQALEQLGQWMVGSIQASISQGIPPPNASSTIAHKGSSTPLIDTGVLRSSISYRVEK